jgi:hypothetical protein
MKRCVTVRYGMIGSAHELDRRESRDVETQNAQQVSSRLRERLSERAMLDLTKRLIAIASENPPGNHYEECARTQRKLIDSEEGD